MLVSPIKMHNQPSINFNGKRPNSKDLKGILNSYPFVDTAVPFATAGAFVLNNLKGFNSSLTITDEIKKTGITHCEYKNGQIVIVTKKNGAFYKITPKKLFFDTTLEEILLTELNDDKVSAISGFKNYKDCIDNLGRQDIVKKGLGIHTYELDSDIPYDKKNIAAKAITRHSKIAVSAQNLFFIEGNAFFYDKTNKTVYSVKPKNDKSTVYGCKFVTDNNGHAIGYDREIWSIYYDSQVQDKYIEQTEPSKTLPDCVNYNDNKGFAEACRFGNSKPSSRTKNGIPTVLSKLESFGFENVKEQDLQIVKYNYDKSDEARDYYLINYYNPLSGKSLTFDKEGKYLYQTEYVKDDNGQILFCTHENY